MAYTLPPNDLTNGSQGIEQLFIYTSQQVPFLMPGILLFLFFVILGSGYFFQDRRVGRGNFPMWCAIASFITTTGAFFLFLYDNLINIEILVIGVSLTIICAMWFMLSGNE